MVSHRRFELRTPWLKVKCSANWANGSNERKWLGWLDSNQRNDGVKVRCLTAWLHPNGIFFITLVGWIVGFEPTVSSATNWRFNQLSYTHHVVRQKGLEPLTYCLEGSCSIQLSYWRRIKNMERVMGIEPTRPAWKAGVLPLNYTRGTPTRYILAHTSLASQAIFSFFVMFWKLWWVPQIELL